MLFKQNVDDKRKSVRIDFKVPAEIFYPATDTVYNGTLVNLSVHGMLVDMQDNCHAVVHEGNCMARLIFTGKGSRLMIDELESSVVRYSDNKLALEFSEPLEWFLLFSVYKSKQISE